MTHFPLPVNCLTVLYKKCHRLKPEEIHQFTVNYIRTETGEKGTKHFEQNSCTLLKQKTLGKKIFDGREVPTVGAHQTAHKILVHLCTHITLKKQPKN